MSYDGFTNVISYVVVVIMIKKQYTLKYIILYMWVFMMIQILISYENFELTLSNNIMNTSTC